MCIRDSRNVQRIVVADGGTVQVLSLAFVYGREPGRTLLAELWLAWDEFTRIQQQVQGGELLSTALADLRARLLRDEPTQTVLESICSWASRLLGGDSACIMEFDDGGVLTITAVGEHAPTSMIGSQWQLNRAEFGEALAARQTTSYKVSPSELVESHTEYPSPPMLVEDLHLAMAPVLAVDRTLGALIVCRSGREFDSERELLELFASEVSAALTLTHLRADLARLAVVEDRERIARNLHDEVTQDLIGVRLQLVNLVRDVPDPGIRTRINEALDELDLATARLRDVIGGLELEASVEEFLATLRSIVSGKARNALLGWSVDVEGDVTRLDGDERIEILRVLNEAASNVARHAHANRLAVALTIDDHSASLVVADDGVGIQTDAPTKGNGLRNLSVRASQRHGEFSVRRRADGGTRVCWSIPLRSP